ncbi:MAG: glycyl-radical enzyme activating protein [Bacteroidetes bacterium]|nr:glycyl-radical enzyme activating protein [Bacteroidota bacterium]
MKGLIFNIMRYAIHDGPGIRTTVFMKGCPMRCWWCHNPESQLSEPEQINRQRTLDGIVFEDIEITGKWMDAEEVMEVIKKDRVFYDESGGGVTFSGGEPLMQPEFLEEILSLCKTEHVHTTLDTCGIESTEVLAGLTDKVDLFLYDLKFIDDDLHLKYTGVSNTPVLENLRFLASEHCQIWIRIPLIPGITDTEVNLNDIREFLLTLPSIKKIDLLPYHDIARNKYIRLGREYKLPAAGKVSEGKMDEIKSYFSESGYEINIGG